MSSGFYHVFSCNDKYGWIIVSADDVVEPVIAYSETGTFDMENISAPFVWILEGIKEEIQIVILLCMLNCRMCGIMTYFLSMN